MTTSADTTELSQPTDDLPDGRETELLKRRYERVAPFYDAMEWFAERFRFSKWRPDVWDAVEGDTVLEDTDLWLDIVKRIEARA